MPSKKKSKQHLTETFPSPSSTKAPSKPKPSTNPATPSISNGQSQIPKAEKFIPSLAVSKFPTLISQGAVIALVSGVDEQSKRFEICLSESDINTNNLNPGLLVTVSIASNDEKGFPLCLLNEECARSFGFDSDSKFDDTAGSYFVVATLNYSPKVGNGTSVLSSKLAYLMGCPVVGRKLFVSPTQYLSSGSHINGLRGECMISASHLRVCKCKEMYFELVYSRDNMRSSSDERSDSTVSQETAESQQSNGASSSHKTPSKKTEDTILKITYKRNPYMFDASAVHDLLTSAPKESLQIWVTSWLKSRVLLPGNFVEILLMNKLFLFRLVKANGVSLDTAAEGEKSNAFHVDRKTEVYLQFPSATSSGSYDGGNTLFQGHENLCEESIRKDEAESRLGGLSKEYAILKDAIVSSSVEATVSSLGLRTTKGILLYGPPGTGKTSLVRQCANDAGVKIFIVRGPEIISQYYGESEKALHDVFDAASRVLPAVVFIDEIDAIAPAREFGGDSLSERIVATLLNLMDGITGTTSGLCVVAATNRLETVEPALRRSGRFGKEIEIGVPSPAQRADILHHLLEGIEHSLTDDQVWQLATNTHGYVGADLASLCNEATLLCLKRLCNFTELSLNDMKPELDDVSKATSHSDSECSSTSDNQDSSGEQVNGMKEVNTHGSYLSQDGFTDASGILNDKEFMLKVTLMDFEKARIKVRPSAMREVILEVPKVSWKDVGGQEEVKMQLMEAVLWPQKHQDAFTRIGTSPPSGILLFGPPGCSKTLLARAVASEAGLNFLAVKGPELFSKWVGESEKAVKSLFAKARANAPAIIFFDEIDGLAVIRGKENDGVSVSDRVMSQLLVELDGLHERVGVTVIAATNRPDKIDSALLRPGRFDRLLYVGSPNETDREAIFGIHLRKTPLTTDVNIKELAALTEGYTGADISLVCREAGLAALEENIDASSISMNHVRAAINQVTPLENQSYQNLSARFQRHVESSRR